MYIWLKSRTNSDNLGEACTADVPVVLRVASRRLKSEISQLPPHHSPPTKSQSFVGSGKNFSPSTSHHVSNFVLLPPMVSLSSWLAPLLNVSLMNYFTRTIQIRQRHGDFSSSRITLRNASAAPLLWLRVRTSSS